MYNMKGVMNMTKMVIQMLTSTTGKVHLHQMYQAANSQNAVERKRVRGTLSTLKRTGKIRGGLGDGYYWM